MAAEPRQAIDVLDQLDTGVVRLDSSGIIEFMNSAAEAALLVSRDRAQGRYLGEAVTIPEELRDALRDMPEDNQGVRMHELPLGDGLFDCTIQRLVSGGVLLELQNLAWEKMRSRLQQREVQTGMLELLSRNLGHEVRNPLGGIRGAAQMLADELESEEQSTLARLIMRESDRIDELIQRFGQPELQLSNVQIYPLLDEALDLLRAEYGSEIVIERDYDPSIPDILADAAAIRRVLLNLLRNAGQAGSSTILLRTRIEHNAAVIHSSGGSVLRMEICDNGHGVPESLRSLLFLPLVTSRRDGTGLGLSLSQQIAAAHGGLLTYEPANEGSCFSLLLPLKAAEPVPGAYS